MTTTTNLERQTEEAGIEAIVSRLMKKTNAIDNNRSEAFGKTGGLMKGMISGSQKADTQFNQTKEWMLAALAGDIGYLRKSQSGYKQSVIDSYNSNELSAIEFKTLTPVVESSNSAGGYNVPLPFATELSRNLGTYGYARRYLRQIAITEKQIAIAGLKTKPSVAVYAENAIISHSAPVQDQLVITAYKIASIYAASNEYLADANIDVLAAIIEIFGEQFGIQEDTLAFSDQNTTGVGMLWYGDGTITSGVAANGALAQFRGQSTSSGKTSMPQMGDAAGTLDFWLDLLTMMIAQPSALFQGAKFFMPQEVAVALVSIRDTNHRPLANLDMGIDLVTGLDGQGKLVFNGYDIVVLPSNIMVTYSTSAAPSTPFCCLTNPMRSWSCMGIRGGFEVDMSTDATVDNISLFTNDAKGFRMKERVGFGTGRPDTTVVLRTSAT